MQLRLLPRNLERGRSTPMLYSKPIADLEIHVKILEAGLGQRLQCRRKWYDGVSQISRALSDRSKLELDLLRDSTWTHSK